MSESLSFAPGLAAARFVLLALAATLVACGGEPGAAGARAAVAAAANVPVAVTTVRAERRDVPITVQATGSVVAVQAVDIKPQTSSVVTAVHVHDGQFVAAGTPLFTLDARADEANVAKLRAQMARDEAQLADAERQLTRSRDLLAQNFVSTSAVDTNLSAVEAQRALVGADRAAVDAARVALSYAQLRAPLAGRLGAVTVSPGSAVTANQTTLVTLTQLDPIEVAFAVPQRNLPDVLAALAAPGGAGVTATPPDGGAPRTGHLVFVDNVVDAASGTVRLKARFDNRDAALWPGQFVNATMTLRTLPGAVVVPRAAVIEAAGGPIVYVAADGKAQSRPVTLLAGVGELAAVQGVAAGEAVVLDGRQNLRPGMPVAERAAAAAAAPRDNPRTAP